MQTHEEELTGRILKVLSVDSGTQQVHARQQDGLTSRFTINYGNIPARGDVILLGTDRWEPAPEETWLAYNGIATVRALLGEDDVVIDDGLTIKTISNHRRIPIAVHNTIEFN